MNRSVFKLIFFFAASSFAFSQPLKNISLLDSIYFKTAQIIINELELKNIKEANLLLEGHPSKWMLEKNLVKAAAHKKISLSSDSSKFNNALKLYIVDALISYAPENKDEVRRSFSITGEALLSKDGIISSFPIRDSYTDLIAYDDLNFIEQDYPFSKVKTPLKPLPFFKKYLEPAIITAAAVVTVVLLFSVRSSSQ